MAGEIDRVAALADGLKSVHEPAPASASDRPVELLSEGVQTVERAAADGELELAPEVVILQLVAKAGLATADLIADRVFRDEAEDLLAARPRTDAHLHRLVLKGYLEVRPIAYAATDPTDITTVAGRTASVAFDNGFTLTQKASADFNLPLPPTLRESFITHHVKTMDAIWHVERDYRARGYDVLSWKTESELVREQFHGRVFHRGVIIPKFPDAQLLVRSPDGTTETVNVEYVSRSYTDNMIQEKREAFAGTRTIWACPSDSPGTADRLHAITGEEPLTV